MRRIVVSLMCMAVFAATARPLQADAAMAIAPASLTLTPGPTMAPQGSLASGQSVTLTLSAFTATGAPAAYGRVEIVLEISRPNGGPDRGFLIGQFTVNGRLIACHGTGWCDYGLDREGQLTMTYTAGTAPPPNKHSSDAWVETVTVGRPYVSSE